MSNMLNWDPSVIRTPVMPWSTIHHIKQEPTEPSMGNGFLSSNSEGFHSSSPSSSSRGSPPAPRSSPFHPLTPPGFESSPAGRPARAQPLSAVTPPKSPSPSPPWLNSSLPSPGESSPEGEEEPGLRVPAVNSHGKVKTFKCKQCEFVAVTKLDFWDHTKSHIKPERMLNCQKCPFVTEYKHHLEYHMRNHIGSKPFQCNKCSYSCVNKSMLNSHLKSHSNVYQYRCVDCNYATKYCHSLKLHLRKYEHQPAMVLNQDGTPNPLPIIDVYGTRRGPKQRSHVKEDSANNNIPVQHPLFQNPFAVNFPYGSLLPHPMLFPNNNNMPEPQIGVKPSETSSPPNDINNPLKNIHNLSPHLLMQQRFFSEFSQSSPNPLPSLPAALPHSSPVADDRSPRSSYSPHRSVQSSPREELDNSDALDLTSAAGKQDSHAPATPAANQKNRRKGRAFKLDRSVPRVEQADDRNLREIPDIITQLKNSEIETVEIQVDLQSDVYESIKTKYETDKEVKSNKVAVKQDEELYINAAKPAKESYDCQFCDIVFKDIIMYTMHMGYHGFNDAFTCNMCGEKTSDRVSFFVHIARAQHS